MEEEKKNQPNTDLTTCKISSGRAVRSTKRHNYWHLHTGNGRNQNTSSVNHNTIVTKVKLARMDGEGESSTSSPKKKIKNYAKLSRRKKPNAMVKKGVAETQKDCDKVPADIVEELDIKLDENSNTSLPNEKTETNGKVECELQNESDIIGQDLVTKLARAKFKMEDLKENQQNTDLTSCEISSRRPVRNIKRHNYWHLHKGNGQNRNISSVNLIKTTETKIKLVRMDGEEESNTSSSKKINYSKPSRRKKANSTVTKDVAETQKDNGPTGTGEELDITLARKDVDSNISFPKETDIIGQNLESKLTSVDDKITRGTIESKEKTRTEARLNRKKNKKDTKVCKKLKNEIGEESAEKSEKQRPVRNSKEHDYFLLHKGNGRNHNISSVHHTSNTETKVKLTRTDEEEESNTKSPKKTKSDLQQNRRKKLSRKDTNAVVETQKDSEKGPRDIGEESKIHLERIGEDSHTSLPKPKTGLKQKGKNKQKEMVENLIWKFQNETDDIGLDLDVKLARMDDKMISSTIWSKEKTRTDEKQNSKDTKIFKKEKDELGLESDEESEEERAEQKDMMMILRNLFDINQLNFEPRNPTRGDGNCFFRSIVDQLSLHQVPNRPTTHRSLRLAIANFLSHLPDNVKQTTVDVIFKGKVKGLKNLAYRQRKVGQFVDNFGIMVMATGLFLKREIHIYSMTGDDGYSITKIEGGEGSENLPPLTIFYFKDYQHYQSICKTKID